MHDRSTDIVGHCCLRCDSLDRPSHPTSSTTGVVLDFMPSSAPHGIQEGRQISIHFSFPNILLSCNVSFRRLAQNFSLFFCLPLPPHFCSFCLSREKGAFSWNCGRGPHFFWVCSFSLIILRSHFWTEVQRPLDETIVGMKLSVDETVFG